MASADQRISLEIVTPDGVALSESVDELTAPSVEGEFGVLADHRPLLAALKTGIVTFKKGGEETRVAVGAGFVEIKDNHAWVLTNQFAQKKDIDAVETRLDLKEADQAIDAFEGEPHDPAFHELVAREVWAAARLELYGDPPPPTVRSHDLEGEAAEFVVHVDDDDDASKSA